MGKERIQLMRSAFEVQLTMLQKQAKEDPTGEREVHSQFLQDEPARAQRPRQQQQGHQFNPYERGFQARDQRLKRPRLEADAEQPAPFQPPPEPPRPVVKLRPPPKKRVMLQGTGQVRVQRSS